MTFRLNSHLTINAQVSVLTAGGRELHGIVLSYDEYGVTTKSGGKVYYLPWTSVEWLQLRDVKDDYDVMDSIG